MPAETFEADQNLVDEVARKQAGTEEKALLEGVMNSIDAGADKIEVTIEKDTLAINDNGSGMTEGEIDKYFKTFGVEGSDQEDKVFGKFRVGRGQIFNFGKNVWHTQNNLLIVDFDNDEARVDAEAVDLGSLGEDEYHDGDEVVAVNKTTGYNKVKASSKFHGTHIRVGLYNEIDASEVSSSFRSLVKYIPWKFGVELIINGEEFHADFEPDKETDLAYYKVVTGKSWPKVHLYNQGAKVNDIHFDKIGATVITKVDLDISLSRKEIIDSDGKWEEMKAELKDVATEKYMEADDLQEHERKTLLRKASEDTQVFREIVDKDLIQDTDGDHYSIDDLSGRSITFASKGNALASHAMKMTDAVAVNEDFREELNSFIDDENKKDLDEFVQEDMTYEMVKVDPNQISTRRKENLLKSRWVLDEIGFRGDLSVGHSNVANVWKDEGGTIFIDKNYLNKKQSVFSTEIVIELLRHVAHNGDTRGEFTEDASFQRKFISYTEKLPKIQQTLMSSRDVTEEVHYHF